MSRGDLPRKRCKERAVERGHRSLYHHPKAEERTGWGEGGHVEEVAGGGR